MPRILRSGAIYDYVNDIFYPRRDRWIYYCQYIGKIGLNYILPFVEQNDFRSLRLHWYWGTQQSTQ